MSCGDENPEGIAQDHRSYYGGYPSWSENLDWRSYDYGQCNWAGQIVIYKPKDSSSNNNNNIDDDNSNNTGDNDYDNYSESEEDYYGGVK